MRFFRWPAVAAFLVVAGMADYVWLGGGFAIMVTKFSRGLALAAFVAASGAVFLIGRVRAQIDRPPSGDGRPVGDGWRR